jgi:integrase/recombinase XerC
MVESAHIKSDTLTLCAPDLQKQLQDWQTYLKSEKNVSRHTLRAYAGDVTHFVKFLNGHIGKPVSIGDLSDAGIREFRAWMSRKAMDGTSNASRARSLSGVKNFLSWMDKHGVMHNAAIESLRSPKLPHKIPRPLHEVQARKVLESAQDLAKKDWVGRRDRALFTILYGCGLRIDEALSLNLGDLPRDGYIRVTGKGRKERQVPVIEIVERNLNLYLESCPFPAEDGRAIFLGTKGERLNQGVAQKGHAQSAPGIGPAGERDPARPPAQLRHAFIAERREFKGNPGTARPCILEHNATLHRNQRGRNAENLPRRASKGLDMNRPFMNGQRRFFDDFLKRRVRVAGAGDILRR